MEREGNCGKCFQSLSHRLVVGKRVYSLPLPERVMAFKGRGYSEKCVRSLLLCVRILMRILLRKERKRTFVSMLVSFVVVSVKVTGCVNGISCDELGTWG